MEPHPDTGMYNGKFGIWLFLASEVMLFGALFSSYVLLRVGAPAGTWPKHGADILDVPLATLNTAVLISSSVTMVLAWASLKMKQVAKGQMWLTITFLLAGTFLVVKFFEYKDKYNHYEVFLNAPIAVDGHEVTSIKGHLAKDCPPMERNKNTGAFEVAEYVTIEPDAAHGSSHHGSAVKVEKDKIKRVTNYFPRHSTFLATYFTLTGLHGLHIIGGMVVILYFMITGTAFSKKNPDKYANRIECTGLYWHFVDLVWIFLFPVLYLL
jgi:cytochrome c oxidase subunit 3